MAVLKNSRHECFAQELAKGRTASAAYKLAGYDDNRGNATRMKANESIRARVVELQDQSASGVVVTLETIARELDENREFAF